MTATLYWGRHGSPRRLRHGWWLREPNGNVLMVHGPSICATSGGGPLMALEVVRQEMAYQGVIYVEPPPPHDRSDTKKPCHVCNALVRRSFFQFDIHRVCGAGFFLADSGFRTCDATEVPATLTWVQMPEACDISDIRVAIWLADETLRFPERRVFLRRDPVLSMATRTSVFAYGFEHVPSAVHFKLYWWE